MQLTIPESSMAVQDLFRRFFTAECTSDRVRAAEPVGFDRQMWMQLVDLGAPFLRLPAEAGGSGLGLFDACLMMEEAGRRLAPAPLAEAVVSCGLLARAGGAVAEEWIERGRAKGSVLTLALLPSLPSVPQLVPGGAAADAVLTFDGEALAIEVLDRPMAAPLTLGGAALGKFVAGHGRRFVISDAPGARQLWEAAVEEWKILNSSALIGLALEALGMASAYASERVAFGQPIGANQGIAHPLANDVIDADGAQMLLWRTLQAIADGEENAPAMISQLYWWTSRVATTCAAHALHTFGGYGLTTAYDIQLYHRRAKAWALPLGDPEDELLRAGRRQVLREAAAVPDVGTLEIDFTPPPGGEDLAAKTRSVFARVLDPAKHALHDHSFDAHSWEIHRALGRDGLLFPDWPREFGGLAADPDSLRASRAVWQEVGYLAPNTPTTALVGSAILEFGSADLQRDVLPRFASGEITASLGYTEPSCGSDVFAAQTRATRAGDGWLINGQKMFTSGAEWSSYVFLIARTDIDAPKHKGLTMFLVPLDAPGVEVHPVHTFMDERTNATFYADVRVSDTFRVGEVNGGARVLAYALNREQSAGSYGRTIRTMADAAAAWAGGTSQNGQTRLDDPRTLSRLAAAYTKANISDCLQARALAMWLARLPDKAYGPAAKVFSTEAFIAVSADLINLAAPGSLQRQAGGLGVIEQGYRHSAATSIYGGTSEVLRSLVAERRLGLPRSRQ